MSAHTLLGGLVIDRQRLASVGTTTTLRREQAASGNRGVAAVSVSADVLAQTRTPSCRCEDEEHMRGLGLPVLQAGTSVKGEGGLQGISPAYNYSTQQWERVGGEHAGGMGEGCTRGRGICPRLDQLRRRYGV